MPTNFSLVHVDGHLSDLVAQDIGVTGVEDADGRAAEETTKSGTKLNL